MSGSLDDAIERHFCHCLHHESCSLGLLLGEGNATAMIVLVNRVVMSCRLMVVGMAMFMFVTVFRMSMCSMVVIVILVIMFLVIMFVSRVVVTMRSMCLVCMIVVMVVTMTLLASTGSEERRRTQAGK